ncbi:hypothetical protein BASA83_001899 [Batrachochytrium salamandrivorans]|nr:hypothetical protein BASA83_001899 [Batrachochytrium salamandrivorans]
MPHVTDHELRKTAKHAVISFWKQVEEGIREPLEPEVVEEEIQQGNEAPGIKRKVTIKQAKVLLDMDRLDTVTRKPKSKGYGFGEQIDIKQRSQRNNMDASKQPRAVNQDESSISEPATGAAARVAKKDSKKRKREASDKAMSQSLRTEHVTSKASRPPLGSADAATTEKPVSRGKLSVLDKLRTRLPLHPWCHDIALRLEDPHLVVVILKLYQIQYSKVVPIIVMLQK